MSNSCMVCDVEDALGQERGTMSHPITCEWRIHREKEGYGKGLEVIIDLCKIDDETDLVQTIAKIKNVAIASYIGKYDVK